MTGSPTLRSEDDGHCINNRPRHASALLTSAKSSVQAAKALAGVTRRSLSCRPLCRHRCLSQKNDWIPYASLRG